MERLDLSKKESRYITKNSGKYGEFSEAGKKQLYNEANLYFLLEFAEENNLDCPYMENMLRSIHRAQHGVYS